MMRLPTAPSEGPEGALEHAAPRSGEGSRREVLASKETGQPPRRIGWQAGYSATRVGEASHPGPQSGRESTPGEKKQGEAAWRIATLNISGLASKAQTVVDLVKHMRIDVLCMQETRITQASLPRLRRFVEQEGFVLHPGDGDGAAQHVAILEARHGRRVDLGGEGNSRTMSLAVPRPGRADRRGDDIRERPGSQSAQCHH